MTTEHLNLSVIKPLDGLAYYSNNGGLKRMIIMPRDMLAVSQHGLPSLHMGSDGTALPQAYQGLTHDFKK